MKNYRLVIAKVSEPLHEFIVEIQAKDKADVLIKNHEIRPGTFVKEITEIT